MRLLPLLIWAVNKDKLDAKQSQRPIQEKANVA